MPARSALGRGVVFVAVVLCLAAPAAHSGEAPGPELGPARLRPAVTPGRPSRPTTRSPARRHMLSRPQIMNVIDEALYVLAEHHAGAGRVPDAVGVLEDVAAATPDAETRSCTHLNLGVLCQEKLGDQAQARVHFSKVTGRMARTARNRVLAPLRRERNWTESVKFLKECLDNATEAEDRAAVVRQLVHTVRYSGDDELIESVLASVPGMITYEDAEKEAVARREKEKARRAKMETARAEEAWRARAERATRMERRDRPGVSEPKGQWKRGKPRVSREPPPPVGRGGAVDDEAPPPARP